MKEGTGRRVGEVGGEKEVREEFEKKGAEKCAKNGWRESDNRSLPR